MQWRNCGTWMLDSETQLSAASLQVATIEKHIRQIGLAPTKAKNISKMSKVED